MNKKLLIPVIAAVVAVATIGIATNLQKDDILPVNQIEYIPSDISKEITGYELVGSASSYITTDIKNVKDKVNMTIQGTVLSVGEPINWDDTTIDSETKNYVPSKVKIPVEIKVEKVKKTKDVKENDIITIYVFGDRIGKQLALESGLNFETGENVIVHVGEETLPDEGKVTYHVMLGQHGKYKIQEDVAFNDKNKAGKSVEKALNEAS